MAAYPKRIADILQGAYQHDPWFKRQMTWDDVPSFFLDRQHYANVMYVWFKYGQPDIKLVMIGRKGSLTYAKYKSGR